MGYGISEKNRKRWKGEEEPDGKKERARAGERRASNRIGEIPAVSRGCILF